VGSFLTYMGQLKGLEPEEATSRAAQLLARLGLGDTMKKKCEDLSKGMLQRVQFVGAIINRPELLILDEPFSGLDPVSVRLLKELIADEHRRGATILFSTHIMAHAEELCQHVVMIHKGRKVLDEPMSGLRRQYDKTLVHLEPLDPHVDLMSIRALPGIAHVDMSEEGCDIRLVPGTDPASAIRAIASVVAPARIELARVRLEDVFVRLVSEGVSPESESQLRANLQGLGAEGASV
jgi:ABC-2 type transport system ATP-binding protein